MKHVCILKFELCIYFLFYHLYTSLALLVHFSPASVGNVYLGRKVKLPGGKLGR